jgi:hypothetical protein
MSRPQGKPQGKSVDELYAEINYLEQLNKRSTVRQCKFENTGKGCTNLNCTWDHQLPRPTKPEGPILSLAEKATIQCRWETEKTFCTKWSCVFFHKLKQSPSTSLISAPLYPVQFIAPVPEKIDLPVKQEKVGMNVNKLTFNDFISSLVEFEETLQQYQSTDEKLSEIRSKGLHLLREVLDGDDDDDDCKVDHKLLEPRTHCPKCDLFVCKGNSMLTKQDVLNLLNKSPKKEFKSHHKSTERFYSRTKKMDWSSTEYEEED